MTDTDALSAQMPAAADLSLRYPDHEPVACVFCGAVAADWAVVPVRRAELLAWAPVPAEPQDCGPVFVPVRGGGAW
jgi:hypothetical protein